MNVPYWLQVAIYPMIKDTVCYYCIFIRGVAVGITLTILLGVAAWVGLSHYEARKNVAACSQSKDQTKKKGSCASYTPGFRRPPGVLMT